MTPALLYSLGNEVETLGHWPSRCDAFLSGAVSYSPHDKEGFHLYGKGKDRTHRLMRMLPALGMLQDVQRPHQRTGPLAPGAKAEPPAHRPCLDMALSWTRDHRLGKSLVSSSLRLFSQNWVMLQPAESERRLPYFIGSPSRRFQDPFGPPNSPLPW